MIIGFNAWLPILVVFVVLIFWYASRQNAIDEEFGAAED